MWISFRSPTSAVYPRRHDCPGSQCQLQARLHGWRGRSRRVECPCHCRREARQANRPGTPGRNGVFYSVGGLTFRPNPDTDVRMNWKLVAALRLGDVVRIKVLEVTKADRPKSRV